MQFPSQEERQQAKPARQATKKIIDALFGFQHSAETIAALLVLLSILLATFFNHDGWFPTSQSPNMSNYHRWLYDQFVIVSGVIVLVVYFRVQQQASDPHFRQAWRDYIDANAKFKFYRYVKAQQKNKLPLLHSAVGEFLFVICFCVGLVCFYSMLTPSDHERRGSFLLFGWWPINALIIGICYQGQIWFAVRLMAVRQISKRYLRLIQKEAALR